MTLYFYAFQVLIPISLYVSIEIVKICQVFFIHQDKDLYDEETDFQLQCRALNITEDLGQIQYIFSDKTGTLTENKMVFRRCTVSGIEYSHDANGKQDNLQVKLMHIKLVFIIKVNVRRKLKGNHPCWMIFQKYHPSFCTFAMLTEYK